MIPPNRIRECLKVMMEESITEKQFESRKDILSRLFEYLKECVSDAELYMKIVADFPVFTLAFINNTQGKPVFLSPWQIEAGEVLDKFPYVWMFVTRRAGKTLLYAAKEIQLSCLNPGWRFVNFAPTKKQDYLFKNITGNFRSSPFLFNEMCGGQKSVILRESITLVNGVTFKYQNVGLQQEGELARGESANLIAVDEIQTVPKRAFTSVIRPILSDAYGKKKLWMIGTPSLIYNPELDTMWGKWKSCRATGCGHEFVGYEPLCPECGEKRKYVALRVDWTRAVEEGCLSKDEIIEAMADMTRDEILMEYEALFPTESGRYFTKRLLHASFRAYNFIDGPRHGERYVMSVDWAKTRDKTQILVGRVDGDEKISLVNWSEVNPANKSLTMEEQVSLVKKIHKRFNPEWIICDATGTQHLLINMLQSGDGAIPKSRFYMTNKEKGEYGYIFSGPSVHSLMSNYKKQLESGGFVVPAGHDSEAPLYEKFREQWIKEHHGLETRSSKNTGYIVFDKPRNGYDDLVQACAMLAWFVRYMKPNKPLMLMMMGKQPTLDMKLERRRFKRGNAK